MLPDRDRRWEHRAVVGAGAWLSWTVGVWMYVGQAKAVARQWVHEEGSRLPGFAGAFFHGSVVWLPDDVPLPASSDVDVMVVLDEPDPPVKIGKLRYRGILLEASYLPLEQLQSAEQVLGQYHLAGSFRAASIILDPTGALAPLQTAVARDFAKRRWVWRRCEHALTKIESGLQVDPAAPFQEQVIVWLFPTGITTHVLLTAGLRNPTVRTRYLAARSLLAEYRRLALYETLLELLGCSVLTQDRAADHLDALTDAFDAAKSVVASPFFFASDISDLARPVAIDGSRELIERGDHREAVFWMVATYARCQTIFWHDAPELYQQFDAGFRALLADLGIASTFDLQQRRHALLAFLPLLRAEAKGVVDANLAVE